MIHVEFVEAGYEDARYIGENLRQADAEEVAALGADPRLSVLTSLRDSDLAWTAKINGIPVMMFGAGGGVFSEKGFVWALGTDECTKHPREMLVFGREKLREMLNVYPVLENYCDARYKKALRWLEKIGFQVSAPVKWGINGELFCKITAKEV